MKKLIFKITFLTLLSLSTGCRNVPADNTGNTAKPLSSPSRAAQDSTTTPAVQTSQEALNAALVRAVKDRNVVETERLLDRKADPDSIDWSDAGSHKSGFTVLIIAVAEGNLAIATMLLKAGASVEKGAVGSGEQKSPLLAAARSDNVPMIRLLVSYDANIAKTDVADSLFVQASREATFVELKKDGADINHVDGTGMTPIMTAVRYDNYEKIKLLVKYGADVNKRTEAGGTIWDFLAEDKNGRISRLLNRLGAGKT